MLSTQVTKKEEEEVDEEGSTGVASEGSFDVDEFLGSDIFIEREDIDERTNDHSLIWVGKGASAKYMYI